MIEVKEFTKVDWYGFAGAESFANGSEPLLGYATVDASWPEDRSLLVAEVEDNELPTVNVIADAGGITVQGVDGFFNFPASTFLGQFWTPNVAKAMCAELPELLTPAVLMALGFKPSNFFDLNNSQSIRGTK